jgi:hypothetical protein
MAALIPGCGERDMSTGLRGLAHAQAGTRGQGHDALQIFFGEQPYTRRKPAETARANVRCLLFGPHTLHSTLPEHTKRCVDALHGTGCFGLFVSYKTRTCKRLARRLQKQGTMAAGWSGHTQKQAPPPIPNTTTNTDKLSPLKPASCGAVAGTRCTMTE